MNNLFLAIYMRLQNLMHNEEGQDLVEYALLIALVALVAIASVTTLGSNVNAIFSKIGTSLAS